MFFREKVEIGIQFIMRSISFSFAFFSFPSFHPQAVFFSVETYNYGDGSFIVHACRSENLWIIKASRAGDQLCS